MESSSADGRMTTAYLKMPGSRVLGLRGKAVVDHHIGAVMNVFLNTTMSTEWIRWVKKNRQRQADRQTDTGSSA